MRRSRAAATTTIGVAIVFAITAASASAGGVSWTPGNLNFGKQKTGSASNSKKVTVNHFCSPDIVVNGNPAPGPCPVMDIAISGKFRISSTTCPTTGVPIAPIGSCTVSVKFKPTSKGKHHGFLRIWTGQQTNPAAGFGATTAPGAPAGVPLEGRGCKKKVDGQLKQCGG